MGDGLIDKKLVGVYKDYLKNNLSKKRYAHSLNVAAAAIKLAELYDGDRDKCYTAGLLHDIAKELPFEEQLNLAQSSELNVSDIELDSQPLLHAIAGAELIQRVFGIKSADIINAVRYHTVARGGMSKTEQIIYMSDLISEDRDYKDVKKMRKLAYSDLEKALYEALKFSLNDSVEKGNTIAVSTLEAYNELAAARKRKENK